VKESGSIFGFSLPVKYTDKIKDLKMKILIVEDDKNIIAAIECTFNLGWPEVDISATDWGKEGVKRVETEAPDLLILDLGLPDIDGLEVIKEIRLFSKIPILVLSVKTDETTVVRALNLGANDFVYKPFRPMDYWQE
jgi:DNA-binding response OmpR family regulator